MSEKRLLRVSRKGTLGLGRGVMPAAGGRTHLLHEDGRTACGRKLDGVPMRFPEHGDSLVTCSSCRKAMTADAL